MKTIKGSLPGSSTDPSPEIKCWLPETGSTGTGLIIFPGGGYSGLAEHEGEGYASFFCKAGIACFVVKYRLSTDGYRHPAMLEDALAAIYSVRSHALEFGIAPGRIGVIGSSAGGHLAAHAMTAWQEYRSDISARPDFGVLCYPVITSSGPFAHSGSFAGLAGSNPPHELISSLSCEKRVTKETPPCFLWHTLEDTAVPPENSMLFAEALRRNGVSFELHIYPRGGHGLGLGAPYNWGGECVRWIKDTGHNSPLP